jgi:hypothetical protein
MGDEELNFTEEEASGWASDPRNQAHDQGSLVRAILVCCLILIGIIAWLANSGASIQENDGHMGASQPPLVQ